MDSKAARGRIMSTKALREVSYMGEKIARAEKKALDKAITHRDKLVKDGFDSYISYIKEKEQS